VRNWARRHGLALAGAELSVVIAFAGLWELAARLAGSQFFPPPSDIVHRFFHVWLTGSPGSAFLSKTFRENVVPSLEHALLGWLIAIAVGVTLGIALGRARRLWPYIEPSLEFLRAVPPAALLPFTLLFFGLAASGKVFIVAYGCIWPILVHSIDAARSVDAIQVETARVFEVSRTRTFFAVFLPASMPEVFAGIRVSLPIALIMMVLSELLGSSEGIGFYILNAQRSFQVIDVWAGILLLAVLGYLLTIAFLRVERRVLRWQVPSRGETV
jgi:ABC-type nitrate/sulfonate/bicarbonate transport system permease component